jgi:hypothetical protein
MSGTSKFKDELLEDSPRGPPKAPVKTIDESLLRVNPASVSVH